mgnify:CR=1 FL=1
MHRMLCLFLLCAVPALAAEPVSPADTDAKIDQVLQFNLREMSLDDRVGKDRETPISDYLVDDASGSPEEDMIKREANFLVSEAMHYLGEQEKIVICHRFGIAGGPALTLKDVTPTMRTSMSSGPWKTTSATHGRAVN